jgi:hypothetical protein
MLWSTETLLPDLFPDVFIPLSAGLGIIFALFLWWRVSFVKVRTGQRPTGEDGRTFLLEEELTGEESVSSWRLWIAKHLRVLSGVMRSSRLIPVGGTKKYY